MQLKKPSTLSFLNNVCTKSKSATVSQYVVAAALTQIQNEQARNLLRACFVSKIRMSGRFNKQSHSQNCSSLF
jgi:hypothetical protein